MHSGVSSKRQNSDLLNMGLHTYWPHLIFPHLTVPIPTAPPLPAVPVKLKEPFPRCELGGLFRSTAPTEPDILNYLRGGPDPAGVRWPHIWHPSLPRASLRSPNSSSKQTLIFHLSYQVCPFKLLSKTFFIIFSLSSQELMASEFPGKGWCLE